MGYDPYWPTCLATINTIIVPAGRVTIARFDEAVAALQASSCIELKTIAEKEGGSSDLVHPTKFHDGVAFFNITRDLGQEQSGSDLLEPNSQVQVILGIYDVKAEASTEAAFDAGATLQVLQKSFSHAHSGQVFMLLIIGADELRAEDRIVHLPDLEIESVSTAMQYMYLSLRTKAQTFAETLVENDLGGGESAHSANGLNGQVNGASEETSPRQVGRARYTIVLGLVSLQLGAWPDALRRFAEGINLARESQDIRCQARALEALVLCMALMVWRRVDFGLPEVCEQAYNTSQLLSKSSIFGRPTSIGMPSQAKADATLTPSQRWLKYAPVMTEAVLNVFESSPTSIGGTDQPSLLRQLRIRSLNLLILASRTSPDRLISNLDELITRSQHPSSSANKAILSTSGGINIAVQLLATIPDTDESLVSSDGVSATLAVVSCLSAMGSLRREAFMIRRLLLRLGPALKSARTVGASEAGMHPSSASSIDNRKGMSVSVQSGLRSLIEVAAEAYGVSMISSNDPGRPFILTKPRIEESLVSWSSNRSEGDLFLKAEILTLCINVCDSIGDAQGSSSLVSALLRLSIPTATISQFRTNSSLLVSTNEQIRLLEYLRQRTTVPNVLGADGLSPPYWDDFLVRDVQVLQSQNGSTLTSHAPSELLLANEVAGSQAKDPFIFNPFARTTTIQAAPVIVAGELVVFSVQLQNPLEVPIDVSDVILAAEGCSFEPSHHSLVLGPLSSQRFTLSGKATEAGELRIIGCEAIIEGCRKQRFPIMRANWQPPVKVKHRMSRSRRLEEIPLYLPEDMKLADPVILQLTVLEPQPDLQIVSSSLTEPSLMLLEGEKRTFSLTVKNVSTDFASDFLLLTSNDNISRGLQESLSKKDLQPVDIYEVQHQLKHRPPLQVAEITSRQTTLQPHQEISCDVEIFGRPGLAEAAVHVDFARLGQPRAEIKQTFYTRQIRFPLALTVNGSVEIVRCNIMPIQGGLPTGFEDRVRSTSKANNDADVREGLGSRSRFQDGLCMLSLDLRNVWPQPLIVELVSMLSGPESSEEEPAQSDTYVTSESIQPGHVSRFIVILPRLYVADPYAPIPSLEKKRQFVVSASNMSKEVEASTRENFWYREELLKHVSGSWKEDKTGREGEIDLRKGIRMNLNARMIDVLRVDHIEISYSLRPHSDAPVETLKKLEEAQYQLQVETFATLHVTVRNRSRDRLPLLLRLQPCLRDQPHNIALDLSRRFAWSGVLQRVLHPPLDPGDVREIHLGILVLAAGLYEVNATVEEVKPRSQTMTAGVDTLGIHSQRRIWHAPSPCYIDAFDAND